MLGASNEKRSGGVPLVRRRRMVCRPVPSRGEAGTVPPAGPAGVGILRPMPADVRPLLAHTVDVLPAGGLEARLRRAEAEGRPLRVKLGLDPTAPAVTLGWGVVLGKLRAFQDAGHTAVLIVGDYTARVGDPSGRSGTRPMLTAEQIAANEADYLRQFSTFLDLDRVELRHNSEWLGELGTAGLLELAARTTVARMLERDDFQQRFVAGTPISLQELLYPLLQGWDSVAVRADVEIGGTDQRFNLLLGRDLQEQVGQEPQVVMTHELLVGTDGVRKMSQSLGNYVGLLDRPEDVYGKTMSVSDDAMPQWFRLASGLDPADVTRTLSALEDGSLSPVEAKRALARAVTARLHDAEAAEEAARRFDLVHRARAVAADVAEADLPPGDPVHLPALLVRLLDVPSTSEARRLIASGAVRLDGDAVGELDLARSALAGRVLQRGRRAFVRLRDGAGDGG
ncbi:MAG: Tyrosyl-tRNA synthetase [uncultured Thermoleophilia bacterium]|uniref:Tyrosine--tRNA ligase n=1 Tax=uncultured Thermoleophilia bacterium TaxID=1497501 RepID=A0A6J4UDX2_9ACTN|nr:MAG: Tyrosyl-tRNA synthetase [uncultured Thermoleophilia bacterium]